MSGLALSHAAKASGVMLTKGLPGGPGAWGTSRGRPAEWVARSMSRIGRPPSEIGAMNSGAYLVRGSARLTTPSAARLASTWPVNALVIEPILNSVSAPGASFGLSVRLPKPWTEV
jgi:hypothetical protein